MAVTDYGEMSTEELIGALVGPTQGASMNGAYDAANRFDQNLLSWQPSIMSPDLEILPGKQTMDARARDLVRNDGSVQNGSNVHKDGIVGSMFLVNSKPEWKVLGLDEQWATELQEEAETKFTLAAESVNCWMDASGSDTLTGLIRLGVGVYAQSGEVLLFSDWLKESGRPFKTAAQLIDVDRLSTPYDRAPDDSIRGGVRRNRRGAHLGYYVRDAHPTDFMAQGNLNWTYIAAKKPWGRIQMQLLREKQRPEQTRGVADIVAGLSEMKITKQFRKTTLQQAVLAAIYMASIESELPSEAVFAQMGAGNHKNPGDAAAEYAMSYLNAISKYSGKSKSLLLDGLKIPHFFPGTKLNLRTTGAPGGVGQEFEQSLLRYIAATLGISYEELSKDFSKTNYSSARAALSQTWKFLSSRKKMVADRLASIIYMNWFEEMMNSGELTTLNYSKAPNFYDGLNREAYTACEWIGASRGQIDELKETQAAVLRIKFGLSTHEDELSKLGKDWRKVYAQLERERIDREKRGIILQEDNSVNAASGSPREQEDDGTGGKDAEAA